MNINLLKYKLAGASGSERVYHQWNKQSVYTEGAKMFFELAEAWWLYDLIQTEVHLVLLHLGTPDTYDLTISCHASRAKLTLNDYRGAELWEKEMSWTTFPEGEMKVVVGFDGLRTTTCLITEN